MTTHTDPRIARVLVREADVRMQRYCRQSLREVIQDLTIRNLLRTPDPTDDQLLEAIMETGIFRMNSAAGMAEMQSLLERYSQGTLQACMGCGRTIPAEEFEKNPAQTFCAGCRPH